MLDIHRKCDPYSIHCTRSVTAKLAKFFCTYIWLAIGFMMCFVILFSGERQFNNFPDALVSMLDMMVGELQFPDLFYPEDTTINITKLTENSFSGEYVQTNKHLQFPGVTKHLNSQLSGENKLLFTGTTMVLYVGFEVMFCIVLMNLLVGLAVSDIDSLMKGGRRDLLRAQVRLVDHVLDMMT